MHDPTEGGVATGLLEMTRAADLGLTIDGDAIPTLPECEEVCAALDLDPMGLIASGALLAAVVPDEVPRLIDALAQAGIDAYEIGRFTPPGDGLRLRTPEGVRELPTFERDELARYLGK